MSHSSFSQRGFKPITKLLVLGALSIVLLVLDNRYTGVHQGKKYAATLLYPIQWVANKPIEFYEYFENFFQSQDYLLKENQRLTADNARLTLAARQAALQLRELHELKNLAGLQQFGMVATTTAEVVSSGREPLSNRIVINKGSQDDLAQGDAVVDEGGLVGQITQLHPKSAAVSLLTDTTVVIPVMVERTGVRSLIYGGGGNLVLRYFPTDADLEPNDILVTSGLDSIYPAGIPVARVTQTSRNAGTPYYRVQLQAMANLRSSKYVLVLPQKPVWQPESASAPSASGASTPVQ
ncbi:rod shape-determining protein MreC [Alysiella filiformis]|uniref:Cell shape-determining protein MreC n=1 Tax=Alysiella filiformis DSM 16848 TaxID=1120981 RepID=A0A286ECE0_9NEIS|nr:rod shape-determining protein MreC [Alysiella filiformis]QMT30590.1 rod shape-determining protein MreC [Alysiella filiformis]UBQ56432.1 rod shape-determining protein MreC [Alysiella filiformis DSM 16848]SOD68546.1 rod shape-determining protein MreC [Alysiella filiformis DSM 16848]